MKVGYARVSSVGQSLEVQLEKLKDCEELFKEKKSANAKREQLEACIQFVRKGDVLVVTKIDRLARSIAHLWQIVERIDKKGVRLHVLDQNIETGGSMGNLMMSMLGAFAQFEVEIRAERQAEGIAKALAKGVKFGAQRKISPIQAQDLRKKRLQGLTIRELMSEYRVSKATVYRCLNQGGVLSGVADLDPAGRCASSPMLREGQGRAPESKKHNRPLRIRKGFRRTLSLKDQKDRRVEL